MKYLSRKTPQNFLFFLSAFAKISARCNLLCFLSSAVFSSDVEKGKEDEEGLYFTFIRKGSGGGGGGGDGL